jgi:glycosyltransferase involved in cell wall biosynthesis
MTTKTNNGLRVGIVVPHIFMHREILPNVIFSPAKLALDLTEGLQTLGAEVTLFTPGPVETAVRNITADLSYFEQELDLRGDTYTDLLKKHPFTFITLARQVQSELIAKAYDMANRDELDIVHIYTNEEDIALPFAKLCDKPVVFTHHDPFNFMVKYKNLFPKYKSLNWISMSYAQRKTMPDSTNWVGNIYHGLPADQLKTVEKPAGGYVAYLGRIIQPKGVHLAIQAVKLYNQTAAKPLQLKIAGKHYAGHRKDTYWHEIVEPLIDGEKIQYVGFLDDANAKQTLLANAKLAMIPSIFAEPFGLVAIESLACGTPVVALDSGALPEVIQDGETGFIVKKVRTAANEIDEPATAQALANAIGQTQTISRKACRRDFETRFTAARMCAEHFTIYEMLTPHWKGLVAILATRH